MEGHRILFGPSPSPSSNRSNRQVATASNRKKIKTSLLWPSHSIANGHWRGLSGRPPPTLFLPVVIVVSRLISFRDPPSSTERTGQIDIDKEKISKPETMLPWSEHWHFNPSHFKFYGPVSYSSSSFLLLLFCCFWWFFAKFLITASFLLASHHHHPYHHHIPHIKGRKANQTNDVGLALMPMSTEISDCNVKSGEIG